MKNQTFAFVFSILLALGLTTPARGTDRADAVVADGFYGGVAYRDTATEGIGVKFGPASSLLALPATPTAVDDVATRSLVFGGYRWRNDVAVEASFSAQDKYALRPLESLPARRGMGLSFGAGTVGDVQSRSWNVDVLTSWTLYKALALYGRLGYGQTETAPLVGSAPASVSVSRGLRDGVNYGVGMRYDMNSALGLRVEYSRFGRFAGELGSSLPESDQVTFGLQLKF
jgi:outer membrane protein with beta-barrel domain